VLVRTSLQIKLQSRAAVSSELHSKPTKALASTVVVVVTPRPEPPLFPPPKDPIAARSAELVLIVAQRLFKSVLTLADQVPDKSDST